MIRDGPSFWLFDGFSSAMPEKRNHYLHFNYFYYWCKSAYTHAIEASTPIYPQIESLELYRGTRAQTESLSACEIPPL
jgi:hypothetical protein